MPELDENQQKITKASIDKKISVALSELNGKNPNISTIKQSLTQALDMARDGEIYVTQVDGFKKLEEAISKAESDVTAQFREVIERYEKQKAEDQKKEKEKEEEVKIKQAQSMMSELREKHKKELDEIDKSLNVMARPDSPSEEKDESAKKALESAARMNIAPAKLGNMIKAHEEAGNILQSRRENAKTTAEIQQIIKQEQENDKNLAQLRVKAVEQNVSLKQEDKIAELKNIAGNLYEKQEVLAQKWQGEDKSEKQKENSVATKTPKKERVKIGGAQSDIMAGFKKNTNVQSQDIGSFSPSQTPNVKPLGGRDPNIPST